MSNYVIITTVKECNVSPRGDFIKFFGVNLLTLFCKLDLFIATQQILHILIELFKLTKRVSEIMPKKFYEIDSCTNFLSKTVIL
jgi:hypothetical protein